MANQIVGCDIPALDLARAIKFYSAVRGQAVKKQELPGMTMGILPHNDGEVGACFIGRRRGKTIGKGRDDLFERERTLRCRGLGGHDKWGQSG